MPHHNILCTEKKANIGHSSDRGDCSGADNEGRTEAMKPRAKRARERACLRIIYYPQHKGAGV